jgi:hypothetical protein
MVVKNSVGQILQTAQIRLMQQGTQYPVSNAGFQRVGGTSQVIDLIRGRSGNTIAPRMQIWVGEV